MGVIAVPHSAAAKHALVVNVAIGTSPALQKKHALVFLFVQEAFGLLGRADEIEGQMPKRDSRYMEEQRNQIAGAAWEVMLAKGLYETSLRDICQQAGVSMGALYVHFASKEDIVLAALVLNRSDWGDQPVAATWDEYSSRIWLLSEELLQPAGRRGVRLTFQFLAERLLEPSQSTALSRIFLENDRFARESLRAMADSGEITLPLGMDLTADAHVRLMTGTSYTILANPAVDARKAYADSMKAMAHLAGRIEG